MSTRWWQNVWEYVYSFRYNARTWQTNRRTDIYHKKVLLRRRQPWRAPSSGHWRRPCSRPPGATEPDINIQILLTYLLTWVCPSFIVLLKQYAHLWRHDVLLVFCCFFMWLLFNWTANKVEYISERVSGHATERERVRENRTGRHAAVSGAWQQLTAGAADVNVRQLIAFACYVPPRTSVDEFRTSAVRRPAAFMTPVITEPVQRNIRWRRRPFL